MGTDSRGPAFENLAATVKDGGEKVLGRTGPEPFGKDEIFDVLRYDRRRYVLRHLDSTGGNAKLGELADVLAERESDDDTYDHQDRKRAYVSLYQNHLPMMDDVGIVDFDGKRGGVRLTSAFDRVEPYLYDGQRTSVRWHRLYLAAGLLGVGIAGMGYLWSPLSAGVLYGALAGVYCFLVTAHLSLSTGWINTELLRER